MISPEIEANVKVRELANNRGAKAVQDIAAGAVGLVAWPVFFAMGAKGAADADIAAASGRAMLRAP